MNIVDSANPIHSTSSQQLTSLLDFFVQQTGHDTEFVRAFLSGPNLVEIQGIFTHKMRLLAHNPQLPTVQFTESILSGLMTFAQTHRLAWVNNGTLAYANITFVDDMIPAMEASYHESAFWNRWCEQGIPDPNNIPLPLPAETTDFTAEIDSYTLGNPWGQPRPMY
ncbi:MAG: hypothetical protein K0U52_00365 [Gammaproteobacteria bacterium]|nr:hypothetical protein [Gammaproteobacteria bacterium]